MFACRPLTSSRHAQAQAASNSSQHSSAPFSGSSCSAQARAASSSQNVALAADSNSMDTSSSSSSAAPMSAAPASAACSGLTTAASAAAPSASPSRPTRSDLRLAKDLVELGACKFTAAASTRISFPEGQKNLRRFQVLLTPHSGLYAHASFSFSIHIPATYPFSPPKIRCHTPCLHPNINWRTGQVYLHLLKQEWKPVLSINSVLLALQLLFLEPWPVNGSSVHSATSSTMPPSRPILTSFNSTSNASSSSMNANSNSLPPPSALSLASSKSATAAMGHQLDEGGILNLEVQKLITGGERGLFEDMVRKTLDGGFFFGHLWQRNRADMDENTDDSDNDHDDDSDNENGRRRGGRGSYICSPVQEGKAQMERETSPFEALLQQVEQNGRQANVALGMGSSSGGGAGVGVQGRSSPRFLAPPLQLQPQRRGESKDDNSMTEMEGDDIDVSSGVAAPSTPPLGPGHRRSAKIIGSRTAPSSGAGHGHGHGHGVVKKRPLHRKRTHHRMCASEHHVHNPAAALYSAPAAPACRHLPDGSEARQFQAHKRIRAELPAPPRPPLRTTMTQSRRVIKIRRAPGDPSADNLKVPAMAPGSGASRKRPSPAPPVGGFLSDGEYEFDGDDDTVDAGGASEGTVGGGMAGAVTKDDQSASGRRRRLKKQFKPSAAVASLGIHGAIDDDDDDDDDAIEPEMLHIESQCFHSSAALPSSASIAHRDGSSRPRPTSTMIPDLASFASFHPITTPPLLPLSVNTAASTSSSSSSSSFSAVLNARRRSIEVVSPSSGIWLPLDVPLMPVITAASSSSSSSSSSSDGAGGRGGGAASQSPKRNVSDCQSIAIVPARPLDNQGARYGRTVGASSSSSGLNGATAGVVGGLASEESQSSFILHGRSSSRSLNMFGATTKAQVAHAAGAGLANLHDLQASLPVTQSSMTD